MDETIDEQGPFDGVLGFSQGAGIIMSYLLELSAARPNDLLPFRFAIFCSPIIPLATDQKYRDSVFNSISPKDLDHLRSGQESQLAQLPEPVRTEATELVKVIKATQSITHEGPVYFLDRPVSEVPCVLHPQIFATRLSIPTLHLRGKIDLPHLKDSMLLTQSFCDSKSQKSIEHSAGHDLPRIGPEVNQIMAAIEWLVEQSLLPVD